MVDQVLFLQLLYNDILRDAHRLDAALPVISLRDHRFSHAHRGTPIKQPAYHQQL